LLLWVIVIYNSLIGCRNRMRHAASGVDVQLKKRHDLIPNLVETVRGFMAHERDVLERVVRLRNEARCADVGARARLDAERGIGSCIGHLIARAEAYPELRAGAHFTMLMRSLNEIEEQISASRRSYNAAVERMNNLVEAFPSNLVANGFGFRVAEFFSAVESERVAPDVAAIMERRQ
jgi:LemA protein